MCVLSERVGDVGRPFTRGNGGSGGGVNERARGLLWLEATGEIAGDEASGGPLQGSCIVFVSASASDWAPGSSSFSRAETRAGPGGSGRVTPFIRRAGAVTAPAAGAGEDVEVEASPLAGAVGRRLVRGRLSFLSGSCKGSLGEAVIERTFRLRDWAPLGASVSLADSRAPQARLSSGVS